MKIPVFANNLKKASFMKKTILALCAALGCFLPLAAQQYVTNPSYAPGPVAYAPDCCDQVCDPWYLFAGVVHSGLFNDRYTLREGGVANPIINTDKTTNLGWEVFLGYKFSRCFGLELGYVDLERQRAREVAPLGSSFIVPVGHYRTYLVPLRGNLSYTFCDLTLSALFGVHYYNVRGTLTTVDDAETLTRLKSGMDFNFGAAIEYRFIEWLGLRLDMSRYYIKRYDDQQSDYADAVTANLVTYF